MKLAVAAALALLCVACGQKGPLYLPTPARSTVPATTAPASAPAPAPSADTSASTAADREDTDPNSSQKQKGSTAP